MQFGAGWSNSRAEISVLDAFCEENVLLRFVSDFGFGYRHLTGAYVI